MSDLSPAKGAVAKSRKPWPFRPRWRIEGCLCTLTPLHIGSGETMEHPDIEHEGAKVDVSAHTVDHTGRACIFGSTLKGCIRSWVESAAKDMEAEKGSSDITGPTNLKKLCEEVLGKGPGDEKGKDESLGGMAEFLDARLRVSRTEPTPLPYWNASRQTWIEASNSIDRHTRTAADEHLINTECVPAGVGFDVVITGFFDKDDHVAFLLAALRGFNDPKRPIFLGAETASGKGRMRWEQGQIYKMGKEDVLAWVSKPDRNMAETDIPPMPHEQSKALFERAGEFVFSHSGKNVFSIPITLRFDSHFLVNDPPGKQEIADATVKEGKEKTKKKTIPDHRPRVDERGCVVLPAKSFRGAFRSQAERILRTLNKGSCDPTDSKPSDICLKQIENLEDKGRLCLPCQIFGAPGWKSPVEITDFSLEPGDYACEVQEFVAIDRFTGGGKDSAKFNAQAIYQPVFTGRLRVDAAKMPAGGLGLIALTLRDLKEGDITFGFGAAKGYGTCKADIPLFEDEDFQKTVCKSLEALRIAPKKGVER